MLFGVTCCIANPMAAQGCMHAHTLEAMEVVPLRLSSRDQRGSILPAMKCQPASAALCAHVRSHGAKVTIYTFYVGAADGQPLRLHEQGNDLFSGSHFDEYVADYAYLKPGPIDPAVFEAPPVCEGVALEKRAHPPPAFPLRMAALLPTVRIGAHGGGPMAFLVACDHRMRGDWALLCCSLRFRRRCPICSRWRRARKASPSGKAASEPTCQHKPWIEIAKS